MTGQEPAPLRHRVVLGVTGSIAADVAVGVIERLADAADVQAVFTAAAARFVDPADIGRRTGAPVLMDLFGAEEDFPHVALARWADAVVVAPATADILGRVASGIAGDALGTFLLCVPPTDKPCLLAPAMANRMWRHPTVQANVATLRSRGYRIIGPAVGPQACGDDGAGRLADLDLLVSEIRAVLAERK